MNPKEWKTEVVTQKLEAETAAKYKGGQMEIQNSMEGYLYRGEIKDITVENGTLKVRFSWIAKGVGYPKLPEKWVKDDTPAYEANLELYSASNIGPTSEIGGGDRICLFSAITDEVVVIFPPDGSKLDPAKVEGLT